MYADRAGTPFALLVTHDGDEQPWRLDAGERVDEVRAGLRAVLPDGRCVVAEADGSLVIEG